MAGNSIGKAFRITTFGESHGAGIGVVIDGCLPGLNLDLEAVQLQLNRRRPGQSNLTTSREEKDQVQVLSGLFEGKTTGAPLTLFIYNQDQRPSDYDQLKDIYRPSHADYTYAAKYGIRDHRGGGRSSARTTAAIVAAGAVAEQYLQSQGILITAYVAGIGPFQMETTPGTYTRQQVDMHPTRCPDSVLREEMNAYLLELKAQGDTAGGIISCIAQGVPPGWGEPVFDKLQADLAKAMLNINAVKGFEYGEGFRSAQMKGSEHNDAFVATEKGITTLSNHSGGIQGGISNGANIYFRVAFKPVATIRQPQASINIEGESVEFTAEGRHDPCVVPRAVPIVESMTALVLMDHALRYKQYKP